VKKREEGVVMVWREARGENRRVTLPPITMGGVEVIKPCLATNDMTGELA